MISMENETTGLVTLAELDEEAVTITELSEASVTIVDERDVFI